MHYLVIGGIQRTDILTEEYHRFKKGVVYRVNPTTREASLVFEHVTRPEYCAWDDDPSILFKAAHCENGLLYLCTQTEVLVVDARTFRLIHHLSHKWMNDVHHVRPSNRNTLLVVSTGLDALFEYSYAGECLGQWNAVDGEIWERFSIDKDYRKVVTTQPHAAHPNFCFYLGEQLWLTRCDLKDAICLDDRRKKIDLSNTGMIHDGVVWGDEIYFTIVDGRIAVVDADSLQLKKVYDLNQYSGKKVALGWCRGIHLIDNRNVIVGFSRLRPSKWHKDIQWLQWIKYKAGISRHQPEAPTRVAQYDLVAGRMDWEFDLEPLGIGEVFSIIPCE